MEQKYQDIYNKLVRYCAYQERCLSEVKSKLRQLQAPAALCRQIIADLQQEKYVDEERFARAYVRGKFRSNKWGRIKIRQGLRAKQIDESLISAALSEEIQQDEYLAVLKKIIAEKGEKNALSRGFEPSLLIDNRE